MLWHLYLRHRIAYVPTVAQMGAGFYLDIEPVEVVSAADAEPLKHALAVTIGRGNPRIPTPTRDNFPKPVVLKYAKVKSWPAFERDSSIWTIVEEEGEYRIKRGRRRPDRGWEDDPAKIEVLPRGIAIHEVAERVVSLVQAAMRESS